MINSVIRQWLRLKLFDQIVIIFFLTLNLLVGLFNSNIDYAGLRILIHFLVIAFILFVIPLLNTRNPILHFLRYWYIVLTVTFIYWNVGNFIHLIFPGFFDQYIIDFEVAIFDELPNIWVQQYVNPPLTELMQLSYALYWAIVPLAPAVFYFSKKYEEFEYMLFFGLSTLFISYTMFILIPVCGPRFMIVDQITANYDGIFFTGLVRGIVEGAGLRGGAFPSSHVAVAVVFLFFIWKYFPRFGKYVFMPMVVALSISTVYGQYHYVTDMVLGLLMGIVIGVIGVRHTVKVLHN
jgi:membrane-associated phospholipid phosphatase